MGGGYVWPRDEHVFTSKKENKIQILLKNKNFGAQFVPDQSNLIIFNRYEYEPPTGKTVIYEIICNSPRPKILKSLKIL